MKRYIAITATRVSSHLELVTASFAWIYRLPDSTVQAPCRTDAHEAIYKAVIRDFVNNVTKMYNSADCRKGRSTEVLTSECDDVTSQW